MLNHCVRVYLQEMSSVFERRHGAPLAVRLHSIGTHRVRSRVRCVQLMSNRKSALLFESPTRPLCPVCGQTTFSSAGIHPQCSVRRLDNVHMKLVQLRSGEGRQKKLKSAKQRSAEDSVRPVRHSEKKACDSGKPFATGFAIWPTRED